MNGHEKLSKAQKRWEQANQCLSVTTSVTCDNTPQKIPTAVLEQPIQPSFNCSAQKKCFLCERQNKGADEKLPLRIMYFFAFFLLLSIQQLVAFTFHSGQRHPINIARSVREDPCLSHLRRCISHISYGYSSLFSSYFSHSWSVIMVLQLQRNSHRQAIRYRCLRGKTTISFRLSSSYLYLYNTCHEKLEENKYQ